MIGSYSNERAETIEAFRAWHRGGALTDRQRDLIDTARVQCLARAYGVNLGPDPSAPVVRPDRDRRGYEDRLTEGREY